MKLWRLGFKSKVLVLKFPSLSFIPCHVMIQIGTQHWEYSLAFCYWFNRDAGQKVSQTLTIPHHTQSMLNLQFFVGKKNDLNATNQIFLIRAHGWLHIFTVTEDDILKEWILNYEQKYFTSKGSFTSNNMYSQLSTVLLHIRRPPYTIFCHI